MDIQLPAPTSFQMYQIAFNDKLINCVDFKTYQTLQDQYNDLYSKYLKLNEDFRISIEMKDDKEDLLREYERRMHDKDMIIRNLKSNHCNCEKC